MMRMGESSSVSAHYLMLAIASNASVGGMSTLIATGTNVVFAALKRELFPNSP